MTALDAFLGRAGWSGATPTPMASDAGDRRYTRLVHPDGRTAVLMEAPVGTSDAARRQFRDFRSIGAWLRAIGLSAPEELAADPDTGLMLLEDLGRTSLALLLDRGAAEARTAYLMAVDVLVGTSAAPAPPGLAVPGTPDLVAMLAPLTERLAAETGVRAEIGKALSDLWAPPVVSLRDIHGDNLMWLPERAGPRRVGLLDYQDALCLPDGYDLASLLDDPRRVVPPDWRREGIERYAAAGGQDVADLTRRVALLSLMRNLRILGIFRRLSAEAGRRAYGVHIPRTRDLIARAAAHPDLGPLRGPVADVLRLTEAWADAAA